MMKNLIFVFGFLICFFPYAQVFVPYKVGDKFGISDEKGKIVLQAQFDLIKIQTANTFVGVKNLPFQKSTTSFIINNKTVLQNTDYQVFNLDGGYIIATKILDREQYLFDRKAQSQLVDVFNHEGEKIFGKSYNFVIPIDKEEKPMLRESSIFLLNENGYYSLIQIDKKTGKAIKTFFSEAIDVDTDYDHLPNSFEIKYIERGAYHQNKFIINFENGKIKDTSTETIDRETVLADRFSHYAATEVPRLPPPPVYEEVSLQNYSPVTEIKSAEILRDYYFDNKHEKLKISTKKFQNTEIELKKENGKVGLFSISENSWIVEPKYDEVILADGHGVFQTGYILKTGQEYQYMVKSGKNIEFITPKFKKIPLFAQRDYGKKGFHLLQLFDEEGNFICYASSTGKIYSSK